MIHMVCYILDQPSAACTLRIKSDIPAHTLLHLTGSPVGLTQATNPITWHTVIRKIMTETNAACTERSTLSACSQDGTLEHTS